MYLILNDAVPSTTGSPSQPPTMKAAHVQVWPRSPDQRSDPFSIHAQEPGPRERHAHAATTASAATLTPAAFTAATPARCMAPARLPAPGDLHHVRPPGESPASHRSPDGVVQLTAAWRKRDKQALPDPDHNPFPCEIGPQRTEHPDPCDLTENAGTGAGRAERTDIHAGTCSLSLIVYSPPDGPGCMIIHDHLGARTPA
jgi:hypothetical protein